MADSNVSESACNLEISERPELHLEASQDLELLAQEIAEAAVEEERRSSNTSSPTPSQSQVAEIPCEEMTDINKPSDDDKSDLEMVETVPSKENTNPDKENKKSRERGRSQSPVDETSWEIVDAEDESTTRDDNDQTIEPQQQNYCIVRKFLGSHDLWQKLKEIGMVCDVCTDPSITNSADNQQNDEDTTSNRLPACDISDLSISCTESMVVCHMPQQENDEAGDEDEERCPSPLMEIPEEPKLPTWKGRIAGALVVIELEKVGGLLVASVKVNHTDLLSALASLQQLAASVGLVSYADVDVQSLLARAA